MNKNTARKFELTYLNGRCEVRRVTVTEIGGYWVPPTNFKAFGPLDPTEVEILKGGGTIEEEGSHIQWLLYSTLPSS